MIVQTDERQSRRSVTSQQRSARTDNVHDPGSFGAAATGITTWSLVNEGAACQVQEHVLEGRPADQFGDRFKSRLVDAAKEFVAVGRVEEETVGGNLHPF